MEKDLSIAGTSPTAYRCYNEGWTHLAAHQACCSHLLRDFTDAAQAYPDAVWPEQAQRALRGLIHAFNQARDTGQPQIAPLVRDPLISSFRHAVRVGLAEVPANPGPRQGDAQSHPRRSARCCERRAADAVSGFWWCGGGGRRWLW